MIALTEGPLLDAHDYAHRDYVESFFDVRVDYASCPANDRSSRSGVALTVDASRGPRSRRGDS